MSEQSGRLTYLVPRDTAALLQREIVMSKCENLGLILARYVPAQVIRNDAVDRNSKWRDRWLRDTIRRFDNQKRREWQQLAEAVFSRWEAMTANAVVFEAQLEANMIVGLGGESVLETGITLDGISGLPTIPGSSLKGLTRALALFVIAAELGVPVLQGDALLDYLSRQKQSKGLKTPIDVLDELIALPYPQQVDSEKERKQRQQWHDLLKELNELLAYMQENFADHNNLAAIERDAILNNSNVTIFRLAFGSTEEAGLCVFFDAVLSALTDAPLFSLDVMTPHFPDYYGSDGATPPSDDQSPNPINFLTVTKRTQFRFGLGLATGASNKLHRLKVDEDAFADTILDWYQTGLKEMGIGAKTHLGYGLFRIMK